MENTYPKEVVTSADKMKYDLIMKYFNDYDFSEMGRLFIEGDDLLSHECEECECEDQDKEIGELEDQVSDLKDEVKELEEKNKELEAEIEKLEKE